MLAALSVPVGFAIGLALVGGIDRLLPRLGEVAMLIAAFVGLAVWRRQQWGALAVLAGVVASPWLLPMIEPALTTWWRGGSG